MSFKRVLGKALVYLVLEVGALCGVPMTPDEIEKIMKVMDRNAVVQKADESGDDKD